MRDLETIIVLVLLAFNFIPQRSHHSLTLPRLWIRDSATATLMSGDVTTAIKVESSAQPISLFSKMEKAPVAVVLVFTTAIPGDSTNGGHQLE